MGFTLRINGPYESRSVTVENEISVGRTDLADIPIDDTGLSRVNTVFFVEDGDLIVSDENSTNGTFVNGERITRPRVLRSGDTVTLGSSTTITFADKEDAIVETIQPASSPGIDVSQPDRPKEMEHAVRADDEDEDDYDTKWLLAAAGGLALLIVFFTVIGLLVVSYGGGQTQGQNSITIASNNPIPVRVIDPLGGEDETDIADILSEWEVAEDELVASDVADMNIDSAEAREENLNVSAAFLAERQRLAMEDRPGEKGIRPAGLKVPPELFGDGVIKQTRKLREMRAEGYQQPMDFADLADKRLKRELIELPMATESYYLDVGGSAQDVQFTSFEFGNPQDIRQPIQQGHPKYPILKQLADNFAGQKYDLDNAADRKQIRRRLLRMFHPRARPILKKLADAYFSKFGRPLRVTSLTRSMDYQILLNSNNANSYKVRGAGSLPPHTSGCAFDLARKHMPVEEQNYLMQVLAEMERANELDALIEYGVNACFHIFIYHDGNPPRSFVPDPSQYELFGFLGHDSAHLH
ncbi:DUF5715 family protein [Leptolyngbya sp. 7M]|uniref:DUF5715 family protein n=1 Tax=Leptolyngbya sp. 7M TaxID=2812896 RepID=UPI001B8C6DF1|nr:DUF5715 family protein [Leptolyngbya sp. 7M]QYO65698.1 FHA domain-containing protein [Leptolyngbya sp. 7M]